MLFYKLVQNDKTLFLEGVPSLQVQYVPWFLWSYLFSSCATIKLLQSNKNSMEIHLQLMLPSSKVVHLISMSLIQEPFYWFELNKLNKIQLL